MYKDMNEKDTMFTFNPASERAKDELGMWK